MDVYMHAFVCVRMCVCTNINDNACIYIYINHICMSQPPPLSFCCGCVYLYIG